MKSGNPFAAAVEAISKSARRAPLRTANNGLAGLTISGLAMSPTTYMNTKASILNAKSFICLATLAACTVLSGQVKADGHEVTVKISVNAAGLDLSRPADAREVYRRLYFAARTACGNGNRVGLQPPPSFVDCYEKALGDAVRSVNRTQLNIVYLASLTRHDAGAYGIGVPARVAAK